MKKIALFISTVILLGLIPSMSQAKEIKDIYSVLKRNPNAAIFPNGRYWNSFLLKNEKYTFIDGFLLGIECLNRSYSNVDGIFESSLPEYSQSSSQQMLHRISPNISNLSNQEEMIRYIDNFYSQPLNLNIPINYVWSIMCLESWGNKVEEKIVKLRNEFCVYKERVTNKNN